jgi:hypothetical protein
MADENPYKNPLPPSLTPGHNGWMTDEETNALIGAMWDSSKNAQLRMSQSGAPGPMKDYGYWQAINRAGATTPGRDNPYSSIIADQTRAAQMALMQQMQAQQAGPSVAGLQGAQALGRNAMQASAAMGGSPLAGVRALGVQAGVGAGIAGDAASARSQDYFGSQRGGFGIASGMRGQDMRSAQDQAQAGLGVRGINDQNQLFYTGAGMGLQNANERALLAQYQAYMQAKLQHQKEQQESVGRAINTMGTLGAMGGL